MKARRRFSPLFLAGVLLAAAALGGCRRPGQGYLEPLRQLEPGGALTSRDIEQLKRSIEANRAEVERKVKAAQELGMQSKMLALRYLDSGMYGLALGALDDAISVYPENQILFYYAGVAAARMAKAEVADRARMAELFARAEASYRRAIFLEPEFVNALYGLSVLYALELERPADADPLLERVLAKESKNLDALFLLARVRYAAGRLEDALELYDRILSARPPERLQAQARENRDRIRGELHGGS